MTLLLAIVSCAVGVLLFSVAGLLGRAIGDMRYGAVVSAPDGPAPVRVPGWAFWVLPSGIGALVGLRGVPPLHAAMLFVAVLALSVCATTDLRSGMLPDLFTLGPLAGVLVFSALSREWAPLIGALFAFVPFAAIAAFSRGRGMGWGDVKLAALGGALLGMGGVTFAVAGASVWATAVGTVNGRLRQPMAFGPYLAVAIGIALGLGNAF